jgi:S-adenosylmethionine hydrolase
MPAIITLTTDFGAGSAYAAAMKGVILSINPSAVLVDITHAVPPQDVRQGALVLDDTTRWFPEGTLHVVVVDPGVGTARRIVYAEIGPQRYIAPDNGLLCLLARRLRPSTIRAVAEPACWLPEVSATFHGRDIMAPVAARLSMGLEVHRLGPPIDRLVELDWPEVRLVPGKIEGSIISIDSFGNLVTDITAEMLEGVPRGEQVRVACGEHETFGIFHTYADQPEMTLIALLGSSNRLELAIVGDNAKIMLGAKVGLPVTVTWPPAT